MYRQFSDSVPDAATAPSPHVCIVTSELVGPFKNGGIGTSMTGLVECLAKEGFPVTVLYTGGVWSADAAMQEWRQRYRSIGVDLVWFSLSDLARLCGPLKDCGFGTPYLVYRYLRANPFDIIHFNDCIGEGFYCLSMKQLGAAFCGSLLCVALHSPSQWVFELNRFLPDNVLYAAFNYAERLSVQCADLLWGPSQYLLDWTKDKGFVHPATAYVQQYVIPTPALFGEPEASAIVPSATRDTVRPTEIIFFGRIEERKGVRLFCSALRQVSSLLAERNITVTFLGKLQRVGEMEAGAYLQQQAENWQFGWQIISDKGQREALDYIKSRAAMAVMASPADNSPCTVYEALTFAIPFIAARTGGIPELIAAEDQEAVLFDYSTRALADKLEATIRDGLRPARPSQSQAASHRRWSTMHRQWRDYLPAQTPVLEPLRRLVVIIDLAVGQDLQNTLAALSQIAAIGRIVIVNRSAARLPGFDLPVPLVELEPDDPDALWGELHDDPASAVFLLRAGTTLDERAMAGLLEALRRPQIAGLVPAALSGKEELVVPSLGGSPAFCFYQGAAVTGGLVIKMEYLHRIARNRAAAPEIEYWGLADLAVGSGLDLWPYAEPVLCHPDGYRSLALAPGTPARIAAYDGASPTERYYIEAMGYTAALQQGPPLGLQYKLGSRLQGLGLGPVVRLARRFIPRRHLSRIRAILNRVVWRSRKR